MESQQQQQQQPVQHRQSGGIYGPAGRRLHIAHRRSPSELTPLMSMFANTQTVDHFAMQQQLDLFQHQHQQLQSTHQQYVNLGILPPGQSMQPPNGTFNPLQPMGNMSQNAFQFPNQMPQQTLSLAPMAQSLSHRRNQSALPNMGMGMGVGLGMGPPPAPSSGASGSAFGSFEAPRTQAHRDNAGGRGGRASGAGFGHQRRHSLALADAKKAAEAAQQKRTTAAFHFPSTAPPSARLDDENFRSNVSASAAMLDSPVAHGSSRGGRGGHGRSQSMAINGRGASRLGADSSDFSRRGNGQAHARSGSRNFEGNWRSPNPAPDQVPSNAQPPLFQPGHRSRGFMNQSTSIGAFQYSPATAPPLVQLPGQVMMPSLYGQQLSPMQLSQLQALQATQINGQQYAGMQAPQTTGQVAAAAGGQQLSQQQSQQQQQQQQRKTLFTPYLPQAHLSPLLADGRLVSGILRVNKKNRSDAYVTTQDGLDADIFICGSKDRNRALEGDLVAVELLDVGEVWSQKREKEEKKKRKDITDTRSGPLSQANHVSSQADEPSGAEGGIRRRGSLRQRPTQKKNDDVEVEGQSLLLIEEEEISDERKPLYAGHVVAVIERVAGQMFSGTLGLLRPSSQATKEKQEAERAARDGGNRHHEPRQQEKPKIVWFKPTDKRVPLIAIPTEQAPRDFVDKHLDYVDRIFVACIKRWPITSLHPFGTLVEQLGRTGDLKVETDALLRDNNFSDDFSDAVLRSVGLHKWSLAKEDEPAVAARRDFRRDVTFTIDYNSGAELGNAIHLKTCADGKLELGIHVPDVAHYVKQNSLVDREARKRGTSVQLLNRFCALLPPKLSREVCSLTAGTERLSVSVVLVVNPHDGSVAEHGSWVGRGIIRSDGTLSLADMDAALRDAAAYSGTVIPLATIRTLEDVARKFRRARLAASDASIEPLRLLQQLDDDNNPVQANIFDSTRALELVEELMHKANVYVARTITAGLPERAILRRQAAPNPRRLQTFVDRMTALGFHVDASSSGALQGSLSRVEDATVRKGMETLALKSMQRAKYFITGKAAKALWPHYVLNVPLYTHFTSPTRRYADIMVHRQLEAVLSGGSVEYAEDMDALVKTVESCNTKKDSAHNAQEQSVHIEACRAMDKLRHKTQEDLVTEGIVLCVYESAFDVLIPEWGFEKRVHCDQLPLKKAEFRKETRVLELYWERGVSSSAFVPEDERPKAATSQRRGIGQAATSVARQAEDAESARREREEAARKQTETGTISTDDVDALFDDDNTSDMTEAMAGASLAERPTQSVPGSPSRISSTSGAMHRTRSESKVPAADPSEGSLSYREKYMGLFKLREEGNDCIQDVTEMTRVPVILKTDLSKSPPCLTIRSLNPYAM